MKSQKTEKKLHGEKTPHFTARIFVSFVEIVNLPSEGPLAILASTHRSDMQESRHSKASNSRHSPILFHNLTEKPDTYPESRRIKRNILP